MVSQNLFINHTSASNNRLLEQQMQNSYSELI